jgi:hypothetical protein
MENQKSEQKNNKINNYISWGLTIALMIVILYAKFGTSTYCQCPPIEVIDTCNGLVQTIGNYTINLTGVLS